MASRPIVISNTAVDLKSAPINPAWVKGGSPTARNHVLSSSRDGTACTLVWDCTPGKFEWRYDTDETIHILEGSVVLEDGHAPARRLGPGSVVFFPAGAVVRWEVETHVRKLAFFRRPFPAPLGVAMRLARAARKMIRGLAPSHGAMAGVVPALVPTAVEAPAA